MLNSKNNELNLVKNAPTETPNAAGKNKEANDKQAGHAGTNTAKKVPILKLDTLPVFFSILQVLS